MKSNVYIKDYARRKKVPLWQVADAEGIAESTLIRRLRHEVPEEEMDRILKEIDDLANGKTVERWELGEVIRHE